MINVTIGNNTRRHPVILDENTTLRSALEQNGIDYSVGMTSLDGTSLQPGDLDKTFAQFGITEKCYLLNVVKADNAACIKIVGNVAFIESGLTLANIKKLAKHREKALSLYEGEGAEKQEVFKVGAGVGDGSVSAYGVSFGTGTTEDGRALVALRIPEGTADKKKWAMEKVSTAILKLNKVEGQFADANKEIDAELADIESNITVM